MTYFTDHCACNFFFTRESAFPLHGLTFGLVLISSKPMFCPFVNIFVTETYSSVHIKDSFLIFVLHFSATKTFMTDPHSSLKNFDLSPFWISSKYFCEIKIIFAINQFQTMQSGYLEGKKSLIYQITLIFNQGKKKK